MTRDDARANMTERAIVFLCCVLIVCYAFGWPA